MMKKRRTLTAVICVILAILLVAVTYLTSFNLNSFNEKFYKEEFQKYGVYSRFEGRDIDKVNSELLQYLKDRKKEFSSELLSETEIDHLKDVKRVILSVNAVYLWATVLVVLFAFALYLCDKKKFIKNFSISLFLSGVLTLLVAGILLAAISLNFDSSFTIFHKIFFPQGGWLFNSTDNIINIYPEGLFYDLAKRIFISILFYGNILIGAAILLYNTKR